MRTLNFRQGTIGGIIIAVFAAVSAAGQSGDPVPTFFSVLAGGLVGVVLAIGLFAAINRRSAP